MPKFHHSAVNATGTIVSMPPLPKEHTPYFDVGMLESAGRIYPSCLAVLTRNESVKRELQRAYGGSIEPTRWVLKSVYARIKLFKAWADLTPFPETETRLLREVVRLRELPAATS